MALRKKILVVDDNASFRELLTLNLRSAGFDVIGVSDGLDALYRARLEKPDAILLDLMIPGLDGHKVCRILKRDQGTRHIPILIVTSRDTAEDRTLAATGQADGFLVKPVTLEEVLAALQRLLALSEPSKPA